MKILFIKLIRTIWKTKGQFLAMVSIVTIGISIYIAITTGFYNLRHSRDIFYQENNFADYYFQVIKAPEKITNKIEALPEVQKVSGRIQQDVPVIKNDKKRGTARLTSYNLPIDKAVNRIQLLNGRFFDENPLSGDIEVMIDPQHLSANNLSMFDKITIIADEKQVPLTIVGTATGPEFTYLIKDAATLVPDPQKFGVIMIPTIQAQKILKMDGQINQIIVKFKPGIDQEKAAQKIEKILEPYGNLASFPREQQLSHAALQGELDGLLTTSRFLPVLFLLVAAAAQFVLIRRMVQNQQTEIGILKALGYSGRSLIIHFTGYALLVSVVGIIAGIILGLIFASAISDLYAQFFNLPAAIGGINVKTIIYSIILSLSTGIIAGISATLSIVKINPAESMRLKPPVVRSHSLLEKWPWLWQKIDTSWRMGLRTVNRNRIRSTITFAGVVISVALLVISMFMNDSIDYMLDQHFNQEVNYDFMVRFSNPVKNSELGILYDIKGVNKVEPLLEIPVKIRYKDKRENALIIGLIPTSGMQFPVQKNGHKLSIPEEGILLNEQTAKKLNVTVGDVITVEPLINKTKSKTRELKIMGINHQLMGGNSFVSLKQANQLLNEANTANGAMLKADRGKFSLIEKELSNITGISSISSRQSERDNFMSMLDSLIYFIGIMLTFAIILGFAIIYNSSILSFNERRREFASLQAMGFFKRDISNLLLKETVLEAAPGIILGLPAGYIMAHSYVKSVSTDLYSMPVVISPLTYFLAALGGIIFVLIGHYWGIRRLKDLNPHEVLKNID
ncbi:MAG: FtsX-like permease family protein [Thermosyntropha sp.]|nr:FtsX-like permease family protein [Thermosyntropha sp.]